MHTRSLLLPLSLLLIGAAVGADTLTWNVPVPQKLNLVFNRDAYQDTGNSSVWSALPAVPFSPSTLKYAQTNPTDATTDRYTIAFGRAYNVGALEFIFGRWANNNYIPLTFNLYGAPTDVASLMQPAYLLATESTPGLVYSNRGTGDATSMNYQQVRYNLPAGQDLFKFGIEVTSWQALGAGGDNRGFLTAASAFPAGPLRFDGQVGVFNNSWNPGGTIASNITSGGNIATTPIYDTDDWADPRWWANYPGGGNSVDVTIHLPDEYLLDGVRWAAGQSSNYPIQYQVYAASKVGTPTAGDWVAVTGLRNFPGGNQGTLVSFDTAYLGNWVQIRAFSGTSGLWENVKWQVYGAPVPEPAGLALLLAGLATAAARPRRRP